MPTKVNAKISSRINRSLVLGYIRHHQPISRVELASLTGLGRSAITEILKELLGLGLIDELEEKTSRPHAAGRPRTLLRIRANARSLIGVAIDISHATGIVADLDGRELTRVMAPFRPGEPAERVVENILSLLRKRAPAECRRAAAIAVSAPGAVDHRAGVIVQNMYNRWHNVPLRQLLQAEADIPVFLENNAKAAALGERAALRESRATAEHFLYLYLRQVRGTTLLQPLAVGGAVILQNSIWHGSSNYAGEISIAVNREYSALMRSLVAAHPDFASLSFSELLRLNRENPLPEVQHVIRGFGQELGNALGVIATFLDVPLAIVHICPADDAAPLFQEIARAFAENFGHITSQRAKLLEPCLGENAQLRGLVEIVLAEMFVADLERTSILLSH